MLTKKTYVMLAGQIEDERICARSQNEPGVVSLQHLTDRLSRCFFLENSRFDYVKFFKACGFEDKDIPSALKFF